MVNTIPVLRYTAQSLIDFIYPNVCVVCGVRMPLDQRVICQSCWDALPRNIHTVLASGDKTISGKKWFSFVAWRFYYKETVRELIHLYKFNGFSLLHRPLGLEMTEAVLNRPELVQADALVPVPLHRARLRERGYNQSLLLAQVISEKTKIPVVLALERIKNTRPQVSIERAEDKIKNVKGIFTVKQECSIKDKRLVLIDDIFTTGATVNECSKTLAGAGAREIMVVTAAYAG